MFWWLFIPFLKPWRLDLSEELELPAAPMAELVWVEPLARKTESKTLRAVKRITAAISLLGLPMARAHTDGGGNSVMKGSCLLR